MSFPPNTTGQRGAAVLRSRFNWILALLTAALFCVGALTLAAGIYLVVR
jgi:hypothetical protein